MPKESHSSIVHELFRLSDLLRYLVRQQASEHQLSILQVRILEQLLQEPQRPHYAATFRQQMLISHATLSETLQTLHRKKLIRMVHQPQDKRKKTIELTAWGKKIATITGLYTQPLHDILNPLPAAERKALIQTLQAIGDKLAEAISPETDGSGS